jgi:HEPN domain-containing protein
MNGTELVREWFEIASTDLRTAKHLYETMYPKPFEIICYHCQQAAEKALKGYLLDQGKEPDRIHDLPKLCETCTEYDPSFNSIYEACTKLTAYATTARYPSHTEIEEQDAVLALKEADQIYTYCRDLIPTMRQAEQGPQLSM